MKLQIQLALWDIEKYIFRDAWEAFRVGFWPRKPWQPKQQLTRDEMLDWPWDWEKFEAVNLNVGKKDSPEWVTLV